jgi:uncharacterized membrane protein YhhN
VSPVAGRSWAWLAAAGAAAAGGLLAEAAGWEAARLLLKPLPAACLAAWVAARAGRRSLAVAAGLALSAVADAAIEAAFLAGLALFLIVHLAYAAAFSADARVLRPWRALPVAACFAAALAPLWAGLGPLRGPVVAYAVALGAMVWRAAARVGHGGRATPGHWAGFAGAMLFALSDALLALERFGPPAPLAGALVLPLYWAGQLGIAVSAVEPRGDARRPRQSGW